MIPKCQKEVKPLMSNFRVLDLQILPFQWHSSSHIHWSNLFRHIQNSSVAALFVTQIVVTEVSEWLDSCVLSRSSCCGRDQRPFWLHTAELPNFHHITISCPLNKAAGTAGQAHPALLTKRGKGKDKTPHTRAWREKTLKLGNKTIPFCFTYPHSRGHTVPWLLLAVLTDPRKSLQINKKFALYV